MNRLRDNDLSMGLRSERLLRCSWAFGRLNQSMMYALRMALVVWVGSHVSESESVWRWCVMNAAG